MSKRVSVVIPTLQKNVDLLNNLVSILDKDSSVSEIIVIDNSCRGYFHASDKVRVIIPEGNIFVNPAWNFGVREAKEEIIALLNDDITISFDFCAKVAEKMTPDMGIVGPYEDCVINIPEIMPIPNMSDLFLEKAVGRCPWFGVAMFFYKTSYFEIPDELKIFFGDDYLYWKNKRNNRKNYYIKNQIIYHYGSLTSGCVSSCQKMAGKYYEKLHKKWWEKIFYIESVYKGFKLTIFGLRIVHHYRH